MSITQFEHSVCPNPIFVVGSPRSGTSVIAWALAQHARLATSNESDLIWTLFGSGKAVRAYADARPKSWLHEHGVSRPEFLENLGLGINVLYTSRSYPRRWIDSTPVHTLMVNVLAEMFPSAQFIHMLRDGRRVVHSMRHFAAQFSPDADPSSMPEWSRSFTNACNCWSDFVHRALDFEEEAVGRCLTVRLDDLTEEPEAGFDRIHDFLGVERRYAAVEFVRESRINSSFFPDSWKKGQPSGTNAPEVIEPWTAWSEEDRATFSTIAGSAMVRAGYAVSSDVVTP